MAGESPSRRAQARRVRAANVPGGRPHRHVVKLSDAEHAELTGRAEEAGMSVPRLLVETTMAGPSTETGRGHAALVLLELDDQIRRIGNNLNQLVRHAHQERELADGLENALRAVTRACLSVDSTARWVMGMAPAVSAVSIAEEDLAVDNEWADADLDG
ncbi:MobC family plasmid mobilization relaxosome protein [Nocardia sp. NPDC023852]|uniref:MobC family plasmid mobilization relaxosome protein n=1 Tax=Nocardia sp. NPDC023852 TaxID=3154697 RepID=UPI0033C2F01B